MRHVVVRRTAVLLAATFLVCAGLFAWLVSPRQTPSPPALPPSTSPAATLFQEYCGSCHTVERLQPLVAGGDARRRELELFLDDHGEASAANDRVILDYLSDPAHAR